MRVLTRHFGSVRSKLLEYSKHFDIAKHGDIKGYGREALVDEFLRSHLPDQIEFLTGEIIDKRDNRSGQVDIIVQSKRMPKVPLLGNTHLVLADAALAAIEVKSTLNKQHAFAAYENIRKIRDLHRDTTIDGGTFAKSLPYIPSIVFAFDGVTHKTLMSHMREFASEHRLQVESFAPDLVVVLSKGFYICRNDGWVFPVAQPEEALWRHWDGIPEEALVGIYVYLAKLCTSVSRAPQEFSFGEYFE